MTRQSPGQIPRLPLAIFLPAPPPPTHRASSPPSLSPTPPPKTHSTPPARFLAPHRPAVPEKRERLIGQPRAHRLARRIPIPAGPVEIPSAHQPARPRAPTPRLYNPHTRNICPRHVHSRRRTRHLASDRPPLRPIHRRRHPRPQLRRRHPRLRPRAPSPMTPPERPRSAGARSLTI